MSGYKYEAVQEMFKKKFNLPMELINHDAITNTYFNYEKLESMARLIEEKVNNFRPLVAIVCGSGLGKIADMVTDQIVVPYHDIPDFPQSTGWGNKKWMEQLKIEFKLFSSFLQLFYGIYYLKPQNSIHFGIEINKRLKFLTSKNV